MGAAASWCAIDDPLVLNYLQVFACCLSFSSLLQYALQYFPPAFAQACKHFSYEQPHVSADAVDVPAGLKATKDAIVIAAEIRSISNSFF